MTYSIQEHVNTVIDCGCGKYLYAYVEIIYKYQYR
jgi:hypothetical protein